ncbi:hypothetical protein CHS0354_026241 [Potamilus streckersoni]|uniref:Uncharacterized protein n=1 Tax=Potamilus streckersoni TaxID=2493646 RepID=A0AAE0TFB2_9BIVA|nr:hypothetical protein CHS0354_026241 [Potamilus streckersoni]
MRGVDIFNFLALDIERDDYCLGLIDQEIFWFTDWVTIMIVHEKFEKNISYFPHFRTLFERSMPKRKLYLLNGLAKSSFDDSVMLNHLFLNTFIGKTCELLSNLF